MIDLLIAELCQESTKFLVQYKFHAFRLSLIPRLTMWQLLPTFDWQMHIRLQIAVVVVGMTSVLQSVIVPVFSGIARNLCFMSVVDLSITVGWISYSYACKLNASEKLVNVVSLHYFVCGCCPLQHLFIFCDMTSKWLILWVL